MSARNLFFTSYLRRRMVIKESEKIKFDEIFKPLPLDLCSPPLPSKKGRWKFDSGKVDISDPRKPRGEDASFHIPNFLGVADGVGSWREVNIDAGEYSRKILGEVLEQLKDFHFLYPVLQGKEIRMEEGRMQEAKERVGVRGRPSGLNHSFSDFYASRLLLGAPPPLSPRFVRYFFGISEGGFCPSPRLLLKRSKYLVGAVPGSTTCSLTFLDPENGHLHFAHLGDSGFMLLRPFPASSEKGKKFEIVYRTSEQMNFFQCPFQIAAKGGTHPKNAHRGRVEGKEGDILILATDGVFDNLFDEEIVAIAENEEDSGNLASKIAKESFLRAADIHAATPFRLKEFEFMKEISEKLSVPAPKVPKVGGKPDDISVIVGRLEREEGA